MAVENCLELKWPRSGNHLQLEEGVSLLDVLATAGREVAGRLVAGRLVAGRVVAMAAAGSRLWAGQVMAAAGIALHALAAGWLDTFQGYIIVKLQIRFCLQSSVFNPRFVR